METHGLENVAAKGPLVVIGRRTSRVDFFASLVCPALGEVSGLSSVFVVCNSRVVAWLGRGLGIFPTLKGQSLSAAPLLEVFKLLSQGKIIVVPDEGEIPWDGRLQPLRSGVAWLALRAHAPVVAVVMRGGYDIWPRWASRPRLTGKLILSVGKPFYLCDAPCARVTKSMLETANRRLITELALLSDGYMLRKGPER